MSDRDLALIAALAPVRDEELAGAAWETNARALLEEISTTPRRGPRNGVRRRWLAVPALACIVGAVVAAILSSTGSHGAASAAAATLTNVARVAATRHSLTPGRGQFLYTKSVDAFLNTTVPASGASAAYSVLVPHVRQIWLGPDGGRLYETTGTPRFLTARDRARWIAAGKPSLAEAPSVTKLPPARPLDLPGNADALYARLSQEARGHGGGLSMEMFTLIGDSLRETSATPSQRAALYKVAARLPGVQLVGRVTDTAGRTGTAVAVEAHGVRFTLVFDPRTSTLLEEEQTALRGNSYGYPAGTRVGYATYLVQKIVDSDKATR